MEAHPYCRSADLKNIFLLQRNLKLILEIQKNIPHILKQPTLQTERDLQCCIFLAHLFSRKVYTNFHVLDSKVFKNVLMKSRELVWLTHF